MEEEDFLLQESTPTLHRSRARRFRPRTEAAEDANLADHVNDPDIEFAAAPSTSRPAVRSIGQQLEEGETSSAMPQQPPALDHGVPSLAGNTLSDGGAPLGSLASASMDTDADDASDLLSRQEYVALGEAIEEGLHHIENVSLHSLRDSSFPEELLQKLLHQFSTLLPKGQLHLLREEDLKCLLTHAHNALRQSASTELKNDPDARRIKSALRHARLGVLIMTIPRVSTALIMEEFVNDIIEVIRTQLVKSVVEAVNATAGSRKKRSTSRLSAPVNQIIVELTMLLEDLPPLLKRGCITEDKIYTVCRLCIIPVFSECIQEIHRATTELGRVLVDAYPSHHKILQEELVSASTRAVEQSTSFKTAGMSVTPFAATTLTWFQKMAQHHYSADLPDVATEQTKLKRADSVCIFMKEKAYNFLLSLWNRLVQPGDAEHMKVFERMAADLTSLMFCPEWPVAFVMAIQLARLLAHKLNPAQDASPEQHKPLSAAQRTKVVGMMGKILEALQEKDEPSVADPLSVALAWFAEQTKKQPFVKDAATLFGTLLAPSSTHSRERDEAPPLVLPATSLLRFLDNKYSPQHGAQKPKRDEAQEAVRALLLSKLGAKFVSNLLNNLLAAGGDDSIQVRCRAVKEFATTLRKDSIVTEGIIKRLEKHVTDGAPSVRDAATNIIGKLHPTCFATDGLRNVLIYLLQDKAVSVRKSATQICSQLLLRLEFAHTTSICRALLYNAASQPDDLPLISQTFRRLWLAPPSPEEDVTSCYKTRFSHMLSVLESNDYGRRKILFIPFEAVMEHQGLSEMDKESIGRLADAGVNHLVKLQSKPNTDLEAQRAQAFDLQVLHVFASLHPTHLVKHVKTLRRYLDRDMTASSIEARYRRADKVPPELLSEFQNARQLRSAAVDVVEGALKIFIKLLPNMQHPEDDLIIGLEDRLSNLIKIAVPRTLIYVAQCLVQTVAISNNRGLMTDILEQFYQYLKDLADGSEIQNASEANTRRALLCCSLLCRYFDYSPSDAQHAADEDHEGEDTLNNDLVPDVVFQCLTFFTAPEHSVGLRARAIEALGHYAVRYPVRMTHTLVIEALRRGLTSQDSEEQRATLTALHLFFREEGAGGAVPNAVENGQDSDDEAEETADNELGQIGGSDRGAAFHVFAHVKDGIHNLCTSRDQQLRYSCASILQTISRRGLSPPHIVFPYVAALTMDNQSEVVVEARKALDAMNARRHGEIANHNSFAAAAVHGLDLAKKTTAARRISGARTRSSGYTESKAIHLWRLARSRTERRNIIDAMLKNEHWQSWSKSTRRSSFARGPSSSPQRSPASFESLAFFVEALCLLPFEHVDSVLYLHYSFDNLDSSIEVLKAIYTALHADATSGDDLSLDQIGERLPGADKDALRKALEKARIASLLLIAKQYLKSKYPLKDKWGTFVPSATGTRDDKLAHFNSLQWNPLEEVTGPVPQSDDEIIKRIDVFRKLYGDDLDVRFSEPAGDASSATPTQPKQRSQGAFGRTKRPASASVSAKAKRRKSRKSFLRMENHDDDDADYDPSKDF